jgi:dynein light intermediate chain 2
MKKRSERIWRGHEDAQQIDLLPIPVVVIANKYDVFLNEETEKLKWMSRVLRYFAHKNGASLLYISSRDTRATTALRATLNHLIFGLPGKKMNQTEYTGNILITAGADSF